MRILVTGANGQLGQTLKESVPKTVSGESLLVTFLDRNHLDLTNKDECREVIKKFQPDWLINTAAYTAVDKAQEEPHLAHAINAEAPAVFASTMAEYGGRMLHISTDFVFNGNQAYPYSVDQKINPLCVYGESKAAGEELVLASLGPTGRGTVLRTSWLYSIRGKNFMRTILRLNNERDMISVVSDQVGCPTSTDSLCKACWRIISKAQIPNSPLPPIMHWSDSGVASWYDFAVAITELGFLHKVIKNQAKIMPISTAEYPTAAQRPKYSVLETFSTCKAISLHPRHWRSELSDVISQISEL